MILVWLEVVIVLTWLPIGYLSALAFVPITSKLSTKVERLPFLACVLSGYLTLAALLFLIFADAVLFLSLGTIWVVLMILLIIALVIHTALSRPWDFLARKFGRA